jgi:uncharacterized protein YndB with AHSA1/START domain
MLQARTLSVQIALPIDDVYRFLVEPANLAHWTLVENGRPEEGKGPLVWSFDGPRGRVFARFTLPNPFHVLDYTLAWEGMVTHAAHVRLIRNGEGTQLTHTSIQQPGISDEVFASEEEWLMSDLLVLKTLLESRG